MPSWTRCAPPLAIPYQAASTTADPDREIVDGWAEKLGLSRWTVSRFNPHGLATGLGEETAVLPSDNRSW
jgi:hypothetical protein